MLWHGCDIVSNCFTSVIFPCRNCDARISNLWEHKGARASNLCFLYVSKSLLPVPVWKSEYPIYNQGTQLNMTNTLQLSTKSSCFGMVNWLCFLFFVTEITFLLHLNFVNSMRRETGTHEFHLGARFAIALIFCLKDTFTKQTIYYLIWFEFVSFSTSRLWIWKYIYIYLYIYINASYFVNHLFNLNVPIWNSL